MIDIASLLYVFHWKMGKVTRFQKNVKNINYPDVQMLLTNNCVHLEKYNEVKKRYLF